MQLSFGAVLGISLVGDIFKKILMPSSDKTTVRINRFCSVMGLSIAMLPALLYHYYQYPLYAILLNQLVIPFAGILLVSPAVALVLSLFAPAFGAVCLKAILSFIFTLCFANFQKAFQNQHSILEDQLYGELYYILHCYSQ